MTAHLTLPAPGTKLPALGGTLGAYMAQADGTVRALIVAPAKHDCKGIWGEYGQDVPGAHGIDGMASTVAMAEAGSVIATTVRSLVIDGYDDWHIPSQLELLALYTQAPRLFNKNEWYWSSTQYSRYGACCQDFEYGRSRADGKYYHRRARAVRSVQLQDLSASPLPAASSPKATSAKKLAASPGAAA